MTFTLQQSSQLQTDTEAEISEILLEGKGVQGVVIVPLCNIPVHLRGKQLETIGKVHIRYHLRYRIFEANSYKRWARCTYDSHLRYHSY